LVAASTGISTALLPNPSHRKGTRNGRQKSWQVFNICQWLMKLWIIMACFHVSKNHQIFLINHDRSQLPAHCAQLRTARITEASCHPPSSIWAFSAWGTTMMHDSNTTGNTSDLGRPRSQAEAMDGWLGLWYPWILHGFSTKGGYSSPELSRNVICCEVLCTCSHVPGMKQIDRLFWIYFFMLQNWVLLIPGFSHAILRQQEIPIIDAHLRI